jgi:S-adenosylmethionine-dependent methyltransferase
MTDAFTDRLAQWQAEQQTPWARLKYDLVATHLRRHLPPSPAHILDAGGGNGVESLPFARVGYHVTLIDSSQAMLDDAAARLAEAGLAERMQLIAGDLHQLTALVPHAEFDAILCHNVIQYSPDPAGLLAQCHAALRPGGLLSLITANRYSVPYKAAFVQHDLAQALASLDETTQATTIFGIPMTTYGAEDLSAHLAAQGFAVTNHYGIRCLCDYWGDNELKMQPAVMAQLAELEAALADRHPYKHLARYVQLIAWKRQGG